jgi:hypothetical protein
MEIGDKINAGINNTPATSPVLPARKETGEGVIEPSDTFMGKITGGVKKVINAVDKWTSPMESTGGDFETPSYFQAGSHGASAGFAVAGVKGAVAGIAASALGVFVEKKTNSTTMGVIAGALGSAATIGLLGASAGPAGLVAGLVTGALLGAYQVYRGNADAGVRDASGNAGLITGPFISGPTKLAGGLGGAVGELYGKSKTAKAIIGGATAAAIGAGLAVAGFSPVGFAATVAINGAAGAISPFFGPRFSQFFRNLSNVAGGFVEKGLQKLHIIEKPLTETQKNIAGAIPSSYAKEALRSFVLSDGSLMAIAVAGFTEAIEQVDIFIHSKKEENTSNSRSPQPPQSQEAKPESPESAVKA